MSDERRGVSRRGLFSLGFTRAIEELPDVVVPGAKHIKRAAAASAGSARSSGDAGTWGDLRDAAHPDAIDPLEGQLTEIAHAVIDAAAIQTGHEVLVIGPAHTTVARLARERGADVSFVQDPEDIPHPEESFDAVVSAFGVVYAERRQDALSEIFRVGRPDGMVSLATWTRSGFMGAWYGLAARHALPANAPDPTDWGRAQTMRDELEVHAGDDVALTGEVVALEFANPGTAWLAFSHLPGPVTAAIERLDEDRREAMRVEFTHLLPEADPEGDEAAVELDVRVQLIAARVV